MAHSPAETQSRRDVAAPWPKVRLGEICDVFTGKKDVNQTVATGAYRFFSCSPSPFYSDEYLYDGEAVIVAGNGSYTGRTQFYSGKFDLYQRTYACVAKEADACCVKYVFYAMKAYFEPEIRGGKRGAAIPYIVKSNLTDYKISLPPLPVQRAIAKRLSAYDNLIENNCRRIAILETKAEQLYKEWFVRRRYPGHEKAKWIGGLPEGWRVEKIKNVVQRLPFGRTYKEKELSSEGKVIVVDQSTKQWLGFHDDAPSHFANAEKPIILFGDHSCKFQLMTQDFSLGENVIPFIAEKKLNTYYLYYSVHRLICTEEYKRHWGRLSAMKILIPSLDKQNSFANIVAKHAALILNLQRQNALLAKERDLLLPRLMSGKMAAAESLPTGQGVMP